MSDCRSHGLGDCPQHATSGIGLLRRQYDEMVSENARLTALLAERDAEVARLRARAERAEAALRRVVEQGERVDRDEISGLDAIMIAEDVASTALATASDGAATNPDATIDGIMGDLCDMDQDDPDHPDALIVHYDTLRRIIERWVVHGGIEPALAGSRERAQGEGAGRDGE